MDSEWVRELFKCMHRFENDPRGGTGLRRLDVFIRIGFCIMAAVQLISRSLSTLFQGLVLKPGSPLMSRKHKCLYFVGFSLIHTMQMKKMYIFMFYVFFLNIHILKAFCLSVAI